MSKRLERVVYNLLLLVLVPGPQSHGWVQLKIPVGLNFRRPQLLGVLLTSSFCTYQDIILYGGTNENLRHTTVSFCTQNLGLFLPQT